MLVIVLAVIIFSFVRDTLTRRGGFSKLGYPWQLVKKNHVTSSYTAGITSIRIVWPVSLLNKAWAVVEKIKEF